MLQQRSAGMPLPAGVAQPVVDAEDPGATARSGLTGSPARQAKRSSRIISYLTKNRGKQPDVVNVDNIHVDKEPRHLARRLDQVVGPDAQASCQSGIDSRRTLLSASL
jgi:hypothetical protein